MNGSTLTSAVGLTFLFVHGARVFCPLRESVSHTGHVFAFAAECIWVLWENRETLSRLLAVIRSRPNE